MRWALESAATDLENCFNDDRDDYGLESGEYSGDGRQGTVSCIGIGQGQQDKDGWNYKEGPGNDAARSAMQEPADVDRELLGLRPRQQHAVVQGMQKSLFAKPAAPIDQFAVHNRDLTSRAAERDEAELDPKPKGLGK